MERISEKKFQKLSSEEMGDLKAGKNVVFHHSCVGGVDGPPVSETVYGYSWANRVFTSHTKSDVKRVVYDQAYDC